MTNSISVGAVNFEKVTPVDWFMRFGVKVGWCSRIGLNISDRSSARTEFL